VREVGYRFPDPHIKDSENYRVAMKFPRSVAVVAASMTPTLLPSAAKALPVYLHMHKE
jgi:hypothetical protein